MGVHTTTSPRLTGRQKLVFISLLIAIVVGFLWLVRDVLSPFLWAIIAAYVFNPLVNVLSAKSRLKRSWIIIAIYVLFAGIVLYAFSALMPRLRAELFAFRADYPTMAESFQQNVMGGDAIRVFGSTIDAQDITDVINEGMKRLPESALHAVVRTVEFLAQLLVFLVATFILLLEAQKIKAATLKVIPEAYREEISTVGAEINRVLGLYIRGQLFLFVLMSSVTFIALGPILQVPYALLLSIMTGALEWFPIIGPITAAAISSTVGILQPTNVLGWPSWSFAVLIVVVYTVLRHAEDYIVIPNVIGKVVNLHPLLVMLALFSGGAIGGIFGIFVAVPVAAVLKVVTRYIYQKLVE